MDQSAGLPASSLRRAKVGGAGWTALRRALGWPGRVVRARALAARFASLTDHELSDIGLMRRDVEALGALPLDADPSLALRRRVEERRRARRPAG